MTMIPQRYRRMDRQLALTILRSARLRAAKTIILDLQCTAVSLQSTKQTFCFTHCEYQFTQMSSFHCITWNQHKKSMLELEQQATKVAQSSLTRQTHSRLGKLGVSGFKSAVFLECNESATRAAPVPHL